MDAEKITALEFDIPIQPDLADLIQRLLKDQKLLQFAAENGGADILGGVVATQSHSLDGDATADGLGGKRLFINKAGELQAETYNEVLGLPNKDKKTSLSVEVDTSQGGSPALKFASTDVGIKPGDPRAYLEAIIQNKSKENAIENLVRQILAEFKLKLTEHFRLKTQSLSCVKMDNKLSLLNDECDPQRNTSVDKAAAIEKLKIFVTENALDKILETSATEILAEVGQLPDLVKSLKPDASDVLEAEIIAAANKISAELTIFFGLTVEFYKQILQADFQKAQRFIEIHKRNAEMRERINSL